MSGNGSVVRVLLVDDYEGFRQFVYSTLGKIRELRMVGEASDGLEAVQKAKELQPDLILLDIELPSLNGIEAARRIRKLVPESKILILSQERDADVAQELFSLGVDQDNFTFGVDDHNGIRSRLHESAKFLLCPPLLTNVPRYLPKPS